MEYPVSNTQTEHTRSALPQFMEDSMLDTDTYLYELFDDSEIEGYTLDQLVGMVKYKWGDYEVHPRDGEDIDYTPMVDENDDYFLEQVEKVSGIESQTCPAVRAQAQARAQAWIPTLNATLSNSALLKTRLNPTAVRAVPRERKGLLYRSQRVYHPCYNRMLRSRRPHHGSLQPSLLTATLNALFS